MGAGASLGLAIASKTLPAVFLPYLFLTRRWRMLLGTLFVFGALFLAVCWIQGVSLWDGAYSLLYQNGNATKTDTSIYEYSPRAAIARALAGGNPTLSPEQARQAIALHTALSAVVAILAAWVLLYRSRRDPPAWGLTFGLIAATMLVVSPSSHVFSYVLLLPAWTAGLASLLQRPTSFGTMAMWLGLVASYVLSGFDQPFFLMQRLFGFGLVVPQNWLTWHLPIFALMLLWLTVAALLLTDSRMAEDRYAQRSWMRAPTALSLPTRSS